jgi:hypothetical protein
VIGFDEREIAYKVLTTMHNRNHNKSRVQDLLAKNYVLMRRFDDNGDAIDSDPLPTHFDTLNFVSVSDYKWDPKPSYIQLDKHIFVTNRAPRNLVGKLVDSSQCAKLYKIRLEGDSQFNARMLTALGQPAHQAENSVDSQVIPPVSHVEHLLTTVV